MNDELTKTPRPVSPGTLPGETGRAGALPPAAGCRRYSASVAAARLITAATAAGLDT